LAHNGFEMSGRGTLLLLFFEHPHNTT
jgi:hypothetical protein